MHHPFRIPAIISLIALILPICPASAIDRNNGLLSQWEAETGKRFDIMDGYLKGLMKDIIFDDDTPLPGGIFAAYLSFNCIDFENRELGCGLYCDNQWGGNPDEQYYFFPLKYQILGKNHFRLERDANREIQTNKEASLQWASRSDELNRLIEELCHPEGWLISMERIGESGKVRWILSRADDPQHKILYQDCWLRQ